MKNSLDIPTILKELHTLTGFRASIHDTDYREIAAYPQKSCPFCAHLTQEENSDLICRSCHREAFERVKCTEEIYLYRCKFGLCEAVSPLYHFGVLTGYLKLGQIVEQGAEARRLIADAVSSYLANGSPAKELIDTVTKVSAERIESSVAMLTVCADYISHSNLLASPERDLAELTRKYIHRNYADRLTIKDLCLYFHCSKSTLINCFEQRYNISVNKYITKVRLEHAQSLLAKSNATICDISLQCGFSDQGYFSKVFQKEIHMTPTQYREMCAHS